METIQGHLYDYPKYYDLIFGSDWKAEFDFLTWTFEQLAKCKVQRVFEPACGTGRLLFRLAKAGFDVSGLDLNQRAVDFCNHRLARHGLPETAVIGDMTDFRLPRKAHAAFNMINSFRHLVSGKQAANHLKCMAAALTKGGVYVLGIHLTPVIGTPMDGESWSARRGHLVVNTCMRTIDRDLQSREERFSMAYDVFTPTRSFRIEDQLVFRTYTAKQFKQLLAAVPEFEIAGIFDFSYEVDRPITLGPDTEDAVFVLRKR